MFKVLAIAALAFLGVQADPIVRDLPTNFTLCKGFESDAIDIRTVKLGVPSIGKPVETYISGYLGRTLKKGGQIKITAKVGFLIVNTNILDQCDLMAEQSPYRCDLRPEQIPGLYNQTIIYQVPKDAPKGVTFTLRVEAFNGNDDGTLSDKDRVSCFTGPMVINN